MRCTLPLYLVLAGTMLCQCAGAEDGPIGSSAAIQAITTIGVYETFMSLSAADRSAALGRLGALTFTQYASLGLSQASAAPVFVDGIAQSNSRAQWLAVKDKVTTLDQQYRSIGAFWQENHISPASLSLAEVKSLMDPSSSKDEGSALALDWVATPSLSNKNCQADFSQLSVTAMRDAMWIMGSAANEQWPLGNQDGGIALPKKKIATWAKNYGSGMLPEDINNYFSPDCWKAVWTNRTPTRTSYLMGGVAYDPNTGNYLPPGTDPTAQTGTNPAYSGQQTTLSGACANLINAAVQAMTAAAASMVGPGECPGP